MCRCFKAGGSKTHLALQVALRAQGIPYTLVRDHSIFERSEVQHVLAYLRLAINHRDDEAFRKVINVPSRQLGDAFLDLLQRAYDALALSPDSATEGRLGDGQRTGGGGGQQVAQPQNQQQPQQQEEEGEDMGHEHGTGGSPVCLLAVTEALLGHGCGRLRRRSARLQYQLATRHRKGAQEFVDTLQSLRAVLWTEGPAGAIKQVGWKHA